MGDQAPRRKPAADAAGAPAVQELPATAAAVVDAPATTASPSPSSRPASPAAAVAGTTTQSRAEELAATLGSDAPEVADSGLRLLACAVLGYPSGDDGTDADFLAADGDARE
jgi:hypothetical protein